MDMKNSINFILFLFIALSNPLVMPAQEAQKENAIAKAFFAASTIAFLGDSNTYRGTFVTDLESAIIANDKANPTLLNLGLSSETCSGCSEPAHPWPRPNVHERFKRVLEKAKPDLLVVNIEPGLPLKKALIAASQADKQIAKMLETPTETKKTK